MNAYEAIFIRKSIRKYDEAGLSKEMLEKVDDIIRKADRLYSDIDMKIHIVEEGKKIQAISSGFIGSYGKIYGPHYLVMTSVEKEGYLENIGYTLENVVLELAALGIGTCWIGGSIKKNLLDGIIHIPAGHKPVIVISFGKPSNGNELIRSEAGKVKRKPLSEILAGGMEGDWKDIMEAVRLAPSAVNLQPWRFSFSKEHVHAFVVKRGGLMPKHLSLMNRIDIGISLSHLAIAAKHFNKDIRFEKLPGVAEKGLVYITSAVRQ